MTTLVTGAQGFIGSWLCTALLERGERVTVLDRPGRPGSRFNGEQLAERTIPVDADLLDRASLERVLRTHAIDVVFHLAAQTLVARADEAPADTFATNVRGTWELLEACRAAGGPKVLVASSYHAYGRHPGGVFREDLALRPSRPYDTSKACADLVARSYAATYGLPIGIVRLSNVYGPGDVAFSRLVPDAARALAEGRAPVIRSDGMPLRDFLYVEDAANACLTVAEALPAHCGRIWNAGSDVAVSILELIRLLIAASGRAVEPDLQGFGQPRDAVDRQVLDSSAIREELGWRPRHDLEAGLRKTWAWYAEALAQVSSRAQAPRANSGRPGGGPLP